MSDSPTAEPTTEAPPVPSAGPGEVDAGRRRFFRQFAGEMVQTAATVVGAAQALRETSAQAARAILDPQAGATILAGVPEADGAGPAPNGGGAAGFRTPFRFADDPAVLLVLDQRRLPEELVEFEVPSAADAVVAIRDMIVRGAPAIGQVAAFGLALSAQKARLQRPYARRANLRGAAAALIAARPTAVNLRWAVERLMRRFDDLGGVEADGDAVATALRAEADAIAWEATTDHGRIADFGLEELPQPEGRPLRILTH